MVREIGELRKVASAYSKNNTFVFIEEKINNKIHYYNGYILSVKTDMLVFYDVQLQKEFPILFETIQLITPSRRREDGNS